MPWARIDDAFDDHPKVLAVLEHDQGGAAIGLWTLCLTWAHRNTLKRGKTPGLITASLPRRYLGPGARELAAILVKEGLWEPLAEGDGWMIHDFERYLPTAKTSQARSEAGRRGAARRWADQDQNGNEPDMDGKLPSPDANEPGACQDADGKPMASDGSRAPARRAIPNGIATRDPSPGPEGQNLTAPQKRRRGTRIPPDFAVTPEMVAWARKRVPNVDGRTETEKFVNHWRSESGQRAVKLDWVLTWKNWMINAGERTGRPPPQQAPPLPGVSPRDEHRFRK
jgi:hypothetical protein